jgi:hypothetical protein
MTQPCWCVITPNLAQSTSSTQCCREAILTRGRPLARFQSALWPQCGGGGNLPARCHQRSIRGPAPSGVRALFNSALTAPAKAGHHPAFGQAEGQSPAHPTCCHGRPRRSKLDPFGHSELVNDHCEWGKSDALCTGSRDGISPFIQDRDVCPVAEDAPSPTTRDLLGDPETHQVSEGCIHRRCG